MLRHLAARAGGTTLRTRTTADTLNGAPGARPLRRRVGRLLIAAGQALVGQPSYTAYEEALAVADRSWS